MGDSRVGFGIASEASWCEGLHETRGCATIRGMTDTKGTAPTIEKSKLPGGSRERVIADLVRYMERSGEPMMAHGLAGAVYSTANMDVSVNKMYEDKGLKLEVAKYLGARGGLVKFPRTVPDVFASLEDFFTFCGTYHVPTTIGGFAVWNGVSVQRVNQIERDKNDPRSEAISVCKDAIRNFLEMCAMDSSLNPIIYFHQNKVYYGAVENQSVTIPVEDNTSELGEDEFAERIKMLRGDPVDLSQGPDGVFR